MNRRQLFATVSAVAVVGFVVRLPAAPGAPSRSKDRPPNILFVVSDDHMHDALGCAGHPVLKTPHLDRLAADGVRFTHCFSPNPICTPSRACILTGQDSWINGSVTFGRAIKPTSPTWPKLLAAAGYETFYTGKWHNDGRPSTRGFTSGANIWLGGMYDHRRIPLVDYGQPKKARKFRGTFSSTAFADATIKFLEHRPKDRPFAVFLSFTAPHDPWVPPRPYDRMYDMWDMPVPVNFAQTPPFRAQDNFPSLRDQRQLPWPRFRWAVRAGLTQYYGMITQMDAQIGRVLDKLDELNLADDTLVIFVGDHGYSMGSHGFVGKQTMYEEGIRTPLIVRYPRLRRGPPTHDALTTLMDICPTILEAAGVEVPDGVEGRTLLGYYQGRDDPRREQIFAGFASRHKPSYHRMVTRCVRTERYKFIQHLLTDEVELFDLKEDPHEMNNLAGKPEHPALQAELRRKLMAWRAEVDDR